MLAYKKIKLFMLLLLLAVTSVYAQQYPVQAITQLIPPYSPRLSDYYQGDHERLIVTLTNQDMLKPQLRIRLRMTIEGQGVRIQSNDAGYFPELLLDTGIPRRLSLQDLAPYFQSTNLLMQGISRNQYERDAQLPEGYYRFMFQAVEVGTGQVVSRPQYAMAWLKLSEPPLLNLPLKDAVIPFQDPSFTVFQWTPRHLASPNAAFAGEYEFTLVELWDNGIPPEAAFQSSMPLYQTRSRATSLLYGPGEPALLPGKRYAWRVKAIAQQGMEELSLFKNNGYSEIYWFTQEINCQPPQMLQATPLSHGRAEVSWMPNIDVQQYELAYRVAGNPNHAWFTLKTTDNKLTLTALEENTLYEVKVASLCSDGKLRYSEIKTFTSLMTKKVDLADCGVKVDVLLTNRNPKETLYIGEVITAGDFDITMLQVQGANGYFSGNGYVNIPYLGYIRLAVKFRNIQVNTEGQLIGGVIESEYDYTESGIINVGDVVQTVKDLGALINDLVQIAIDKDYASFKKVIDGLKSTIEKEVPEEMRQEVNQAMNKIEEAKQTYDKEREVYLDEKSTKEEKAEAKKKMEEANKSFKEGQQELSTALKEIDKLVKSVSNIVIKAINQIKKEKLADFQLIEAYSKERKDFMDKNYRDQGINPNGNISNTSFILLGATVSQASEQYVDQTFATAVKELDKKYVSAYKIAIYKAFTTYFDTEDKVAASFAKDTKINGSAVVKALIDAQQDGMDETALIQMAKEMMEKDLDRLITNRKESN